MSNDFPNRLVRVAATANGGTECSHEHATATVIAVLRALDTEWQPIDAALAELADELEASR